TERRLFGGPWVAQNTSNTLSPGEERLRVRLEPNEPALAAQLADPTMTFTDEATPDVILRKSSNGKYLLIDYAYQERMPPLARPSAKDPQQIRKALQHYIAYRRPLLIGRNFQDNSLANSLRLEILDCNDSTKLSEIDPQNPDLPIVPSHFVCSCDLIEG